MTIILIILSLKLLQPRPKKKQNKNSRQHCVWDTTHVIMSSWYRSSLSSKYPTTAGRGWPKKTLSLRHNLCSSPTQWWLSLTLSRTFTGLQCWRFDDQYFSDLIIQSENGENWWTNLRAKTNGENLRRTSRVKLRKFGRQFPFRQIEIPFSCRLLAGRLEKRPQCGRELKIAENIRRE